MEFRAEINYSIKDMRQFERVHQKLRTKVLYYFAKILMALCGAMLVYLLVFVTAHGIWRSELSLYLLLFLVMYPVYFVLKEMRLRSVLKTANAQGTIQFVADEDGIHVRATGMSSDFAYSSYADLVFSRGTWYLYINKKQAQIIPERCFTQGDPTAFGAFIAEKTGLEIKEIK